MTQHLVVAISGSPSRTSKTAGIADYVLRKLNGPELATRHIVLRDLPAQALLAADAQDDRIAQATAAVEAADGLVIATPIYKASYSGLLKSFLDLLPQFAFAGKAVLPTASGGSLAHVLALDYGLRPVLQSMGARHIVQSQFVPEAHVRVVDGGVEIGEETEQTLREAIHHFRWSLENASIDRLLGHPRPAGRPPLAQAG